MTTDRAEPQQPSLKPCPFCGSTNVSIGIGEKGDGSDWKFIECESCAAIADPEVWHTRAASPAPDPAQEAAPVAYQWRPRISFRTGVVYTEKNNPWPWVVCDKHAFDNQGADNVYRVLYASPPAALVAPPPSTGSDGQDAKATDAMIDAAQRFYDNFYEEASSAKNIAKARQKRMRGAIDAAIAQLTAHSAAPVANGTEGKRRVVCAACKLEDGTFVTGARHMDGIMHAMKGRIGKKWMHDPAAQGFIDQRGVYMTRREAWKVAEAAGQILYRCGGDTIDGGHLFSENLY